MSLSEAAHCKQATDDKEMFSLEKHGVYELVPISIVPSQKIVGTRYANQIKAGGTFKSRLVGQRWSQVPGIDYGGTFAPVYRL